MAANRLPRLRSASCFLPPGFGPRETTCLSSNRPASDTRSESAGSELLVVSAGVSGLAAGGVTISRSSALESPESRGEVAYSLRGARR